MARTWEQEKAYARKRAQVLAAEMDAAIEANDRNRFEAAYQTSMRYMTVKERSVYYLRFLAQQADKRSRADIAGLVQVYGTGR